MRAFTRCGARLGACVYPVEVEAQMLAGLPGLELVGMAERLARAARIRVRAALACQAPALPPRHCVVNLAPAALVKSGADFDLAVALAVLGAAGVVPTAALQRCYVLGELALSGELRPAVGVLAHLQQAARLGVAQVIVPASQAAEASMVAGLDVRLASDLAAVLTHLQDSCTLPQARRSDFVAVEVPDRLDAVQGHTGAKRALEIAAVGGHHCLLSGPPGTGKTMLARHYPALVPPLSATAWLEVATVHGSAAPAPLEACGRPPWRAPHHQCSAAALLGGGPTLAPGEMSLAHRGVLFLDELPEFRRDALEALRVPLEARQVVLSRAGMRLVLPAHFQLLAAMNPCPCGHLGDPERLCRCSEEQLRRYRGKLSGPLLDRIALHIPVPRQRLASRWPATPAGGPSARQQRIRAARAWLRSDAALPLAEARWSAACRGPALDLLQQAAGQLHLSMRRQTELLRVARSIAALAQTAYIEPAHVAEALLYRPPGLEVAQQAAASSTVALPPEFLRLGTARAAMADALTTTPPIGPPSGRAPEQAASPRRSATRRGRRPKASKTSAVRKDGSRPK